MTAMSKNTEPVFKEKKRSIWTRRTEIGERIVLVRKLREQNLRIVGTDPTAGFSHAAARGYGRAAKRRTPAVGVRLEDELRRIEHYHIGDIKRMPLLETLYAPRVQCIEKRPAHHRKTPALALAPLDAAHLHGEVD